MQGRARGAQMRGGRGPDSGGVAAADGIAETPLPRGR